jgi:signal transduction histidine kinase
MARPIAATPRSETTVGPAHTTGDPALLERLIQNLVENAIRYNHAGGAIDVSTATSVNQAVLCVSNTGSQIEDTAIDSLFQPSGITSSTGE